MKQFLENCRLVEVKFHQQKHMPPWAPSLALRKHPLTTTRSRKKMDPTRISKWWGNVEPTLRPQSDCQENSWSNPTAAYLQCGQVKSEPNPPQWPLWPPFFQLKNAAFFNTGRLGGSFFSKVSGCHEIKPTICTATGNSQAQWSGKTNYV